jgi:hypothetical protein
LRMDSIENLASAICAALGLAARALRYNVNEPQR